MSYIVVGIRMIVVVPVSVDVGNVTMSDVTVRICVCIRVSVYVGNVFVKLITMSITVTNIVVVCMSVTVENVGMSNVPVRIPVSIPVCVGVRGIHMGDVRVCCIIMGNRGITMSIPMSVNMARPLLRVLVDPRPTVKSRLNPFGSLLARYDSVILTWEAPLITVFVNVMVIVTLRPDRPLLMR